MKLRFLVFLLFLVLGLSSHAAVSRTSDDSISEKRQFKQETLDNYLADKDFFYLKKQEAKTNYFQELKRWFYKMLSNILGSKASGFIFSNIHYFLILIALFLIAYKIGGLSLEKPGRKVKNANQPDLDFESTPIEEVDFQSLIKAALKQNDYRLAIRYRYLDILKSLSGIGLISHSQHKSNVEYVYELNDENLKSEFRHLVFVFDHVWYGDYPPDATQYNEFNLEFDSFKKHIPQNNSQ